MIVRELLATFGLKVDSSSFKQGDAAVEGSKRKLEALTKVSEFAGKALKVMAAAGAAAFVGLGVAAARVGGEFESLRASLKTVTGSTEAGAEAFKKIQAFASSTPFSVKEITSAFVKLKALGLDPSERALKSYGNTSSAMGKTLSDMIEAVADASTGEFERLKEFGIKASSQGDQVAFTFQGVTTTVGKNAKEIQEYLLAIGETKFAGAMDDQAKTFNGVMSNLGDALDSFLDQVAQNGLLDALKDVGREIGAMSGESGGLAKVLGGALGKAVRSLWNEGKKLIPVFGDLLNQVPNLVKIFGDLLSIATTVIGGIAKFADAVGGVDNAIKLVLPALAAMKVATIAAAGPWGILAAAMLALIPIAMDVGNAIGTTMSNALNDIDGMTRRLHGKIAKTRGNKLLGTSKGDAGFEIAVKKLRDIDDEDLQQMSRDAVSGSGVSGDGFISDDMKSAIDRELDRRSADRVAKRKAEIDLEFAARGASEMMAAAIPRAERLRLAELARKQRRGEKLTPSESKTFTNLKKKLDASPNTARYKKPKKAKDAKPELSVDEMLARDFGNGVTASGKVVDRERAQLGTTINRIDNRYDPKVSVEVKVSQSDGEDGESLARRVAAIANEQIERVVLRPGYDHFLGVVGA